MTQLHFVIDIEADGPVPGIYSMVSFGAVLVDHSLQKTFYGKCRPISDDWKPDALKVSGFSREETLNFPDPFNTMTEFAVWLKSITDKRIHFWSDNNGFDWQFINYYFHRFYGSNPFGHTSHNINSFWKGYDRNLFTNFKHLRKTRHTHNPVDDARGNAEALQVLFTQVKGNPLK